ADKSGKISHNPDSGVCIMTISRQCSARSFAVPVALSKISAGCQPKTAFRMHSGRTTALAITIGAALLSGQLPASAQEPEQGSGPGFFERIFGNSDRLAAPSTSQPGEPDTGRPAVAQNRVAQGSNADANLRIDRLEAQIRQLTGAIEQLQYRN